MEEKQNKKFRLEGRPLSNLIVVCAGISFYLALTHIPQVKQVAKTFLDVFSPFIGGFVIAYLLNTPVDFFKEKVFEKKKHCLALSIVTVYLLAFALIFFLLQLVLPQVGDSLIQLLTNLTTYLSNLSRLAQELMQKFHVEGEGFANIVEKYNEFVREFSSADVVKKITDILTNSVPQILNISLSFGNGLVNVVVDGLTALIASIYMLFGKERLIRKLKKLVYAAFPPRIVDRILTIAGRSNGIFSGFINGKLLDSAIIGVLCFVLCSIFRIPYTVLVSVVVGVTNVIPFFGPIIGAVPCLMILVIVNPWAALRFGVLIIALQQFDGNILGPKILGNSTGLSALGVLIAIIVGGGLFGFPGMLLGVPTAAVLYSLVRDWSERRLLAKGINENGEPLSCDVTDNPKPEEQEK